MKLRRICGLSVHQGNFVNVLNLKSASAALWIGSASFLAIAAPLEAARAQSSTALRLDIRAGPLQSSLIEIGDRFGVEILVDGALVAGRTAPAISGVMSVQGALSRALSGTQLVATKSQNGVFVISAPADAQASQRPAPIIVRGQKIEQSLDEVASSVAVKGGEEIEREPGVVLDDVVNRIPNVTTTPSGFAIRGVREQGVAGEGPALIVFVDGSPLSTTATAFGPLDTWDLEQVEVFRGPQSTNVGRNALAGAISLRTANPTMEWEAKGRLEAGDAGVRQAALALGGPLVDDLIAFRLAGNYRRSDGFVRNTFLDEDANEQELETARFKLLIEPDDSFSLVSTTSYTENFGGVTGLSPTNGNPGNPVNSADEVIQEVTLDFPRAEGSKTFIQAIDANLTLTDNFAIQLISTYQDSSFTRDEDFDGTPAPLATLDGSGTNESFSQEIRLKYESEALNAVLGGYFLDDTSTGNNDIALPGSLLFGPDFASINIEQDTLSTFQTENLAAFIDGEFSLSADLDILFGLRYDSESFDSIILSRSVVTNPPLPPFAQFLAFLLGETRTALSGSFDAWLPKFGVRWNASDNAIFTALVSRGYRAGGARADTLGNVNRFDPEFLWNYEVGARVRLFDDRLRWNTNVYFSDWTDQQVRRPDPIIPNFTITVNAGQSELYGFESDLTFEATRDLQLYAGFGYASSEFIDFPNDGFDPALPVSEANQPNFAGNRFAETPLWTANFGFTYADNDGVFGGVDANYESDRFALSENFDVNDRGERMVVNARIGYEIIPGLSLSAYVRNLFDEDYFVLFAAENQGRDVAFVGDPRTYAVRLDFAF